MTLKDTRVGLIGLGLMGKPMARNLHKAGAQLVVNNRSRGPMDELAAEGIRVADTPADVARQSDIIILMLTDTPAVETVLLGEKGVVEGVGQGALVIDMGTTLATRAQAFADALAARGASFVDAPVSGGTPGAIAGNLSIMAGGADADIERARPVLDVLGARLTHVGGVGAGQVAKAANQVIVGLTIGAVAEGLALAKRMGVDPARVREALKGGFADSRILEVHGQKMVEGAFPAGGKCTTQRKDMDQALTLAGGVGLELPATQMSRDLYDRLIAKGDGDLDHAALYKVIDAD